MSMGEMLGIFLVFVVFIIIVAVAITLDSDVK